MKRKTIGRNGTYCINQVLRLTFPIYLVQIQGRKAGVKLFCLSEMSIRLDWWGGQS